MTIIRESEYGEITTLSWSWSAKNRAESAAAAATLISSLGIVFCKVH